jgi:hypothetical protein
MHHRGRRIRVYDRSIRHVARIAEARRAFRKRQEKSMLS